MQRTGTTSTGKFLSDFGYCCAGWPISSKNNWGDYWYKGDFEKIFLSKDFMSANAYEDSPWWAPDFFKILYHRFPNSKFVLFERDPQSWFESMIKHSGGNIIGRSRNHCKVYRREVEYFELVNSKEFDEIKENKTNSEKTLKLDGLSDHYISVYKVHNSEIKHFFSTYAPQSLHVGFLDDKKKWQKLGSFLGFDVPEQYSCHENKSD